MRYVIAIAMLLGSYGYAQADSLTVGETTGFKGVFCMNVEAADRVFIAETTTAMVVQFNRDPYCVIGSTPVTIMEIVKTYTIADQTYTLVRVEAGDGSVHYMATTMQVFVGVPA